MNFKEIKFLLLNIVIFIAACIETDIYLPAFPDMMAYFDVSADEIQRLLTWNFIGLCLSGPLYGPLSDSYGRKKPLLIALSLFFLGSLLTLFAHSFDLMLYGRFLQGLGSGGCFTIGTAIIFDAFKEKAAVQAINIINTIVPFIMALAPLLGGYLNNVYGFRSNFIAIAVIVLASLLLTLFFFPETHSKEKRAPFNSQKITHDFKLALTCLPFWQCTLIVSLLFAGYIAFLSGSAVLFVEEFDVSKFAFPFFQGAVLGAWLVGSLTSSRLIKAWGIRKFKKAGTGLLIMGSLVFIASSIFAPENPYLCTFAMMLFTIGFNWTQGLYFPEGMEILPGIKGVTASLLTSARLLISAGIVGVTSFFYDGTIYPLTFMISAVAGSTFLLIYVYEKRVIKTAISNDNAPSYLGH